MTKPAVHHAATHPQASPLPSTPTPRPILGGLPVGVVGIALAIATSAPASAAQLVVNNFSFEDPILIPGDFTTPSSPIPGWTFSDTFQRGVGVFYPVNSFNGPVPNGNQVAYTEGADLFQLTANLLRPNTTYSLDVAVGRRLEPALLFPQFGVQLWAGNTQSGRLLAEFVSTPDLNFAPGEFRDIGLSYITPSNADWLGQPVGIRLFPTNGGSLPLGTQISFDNVRLRGVALPTSPTPPVPDPEPVPPLPPGRVQTPILSDGGRESVAIPEPSSVLGVLLLGALGTRMALQRQRQNTPDKAGD